MPWKHLLTIQVSPYGIPRAPFVKMSVFAERLLQSPYWFDKNGILEYNVTTIGCSMSLQGRSLFRCPLPASEVSPGATARRPTAGHTLMTITLWCRKRSGF